MTSIKGDANIEPSILRNWLIRRIVRQVVATICILAIFLCPGNLMTAKSENDELVNQNSYNSNEAIYGPVLPPFYEELHKDKEEEDAATDVVDRATEDMTKEEEPITEQVETEVIVEQEPVLSEQPVENQNVQTTFYLENVPLSKDLQQYVYDLCQEHGVDYSIVFSLMYSESRFQSDAHNKGSDCRGLMQLSNRYYGKGKNLFDPYVNVEKGIELLANFYKSYNDYNKALMCYNLGGGGAQSKFNCGIYSTSYSRKIITNSSNYKL